MFARFRSLALLLFVLSLGLPAVADAAVPVSVKRVITDFRNDGRIEPCRHTAKAYRATLEEIEADAERYAPDFPIAVQAAREARVDTDCQKEEEEKEQAEQQEAEEQNDEPEENSGSASPPSTNPPAAATPAPAPVPAPVAPAPTAAPAAPAIPVLPESDPPPVSEASPVPTVSPDPTPTVAPEPTAPPGSGAGITPGVPPATTNKPDVVLTRTTDNSGARVPLAILAGLMALALLAGLLALVMRRFGWGEERLAGLRHSLGEASFRTGGTWENFTDWVRLGR